MLLRVLIAIICILYIFRKLAQLLLPMLFQSVVNKAQQHGGQQTNYQQQRPEGRIKVDYIPEQRKSKVPDSEGEFVDYEEIK